MAIPADFQIAINLVDPTKVLTFTVNTTTYTKLQWSYSGLAITGGSEIACQYGASELLEQMGFRFYTPNPEFWKLPASIPTNLTAAKQEFWITAKVFLVYGHSWAGTLAAYRTLLNDAMKKFSILNGLWTDPFPAGHRWGNVVANNLAFFQANPQLVLDPGVRLASASAAASAHFDLTVTGADYDNLVMMCAAHLLNNTSQINEFNRTHFDPSDGNLNTSDEIYAFSKDVVDQARAGTSAIGTIPAKAGIPTLQIGVYSYGNHELPPSVVTPGVYTQVALAFNNTDLTYAELVEQHGDKVDFVGLRDYLDTQVWSDSKPFINGKTKTTGLNSYLTFYEGGARGVNGEFTSNWLVNVVMLRSFIRLVRTGVPDYAAALDDVVGDIFDDDPAVRDLYELWSDPGQSFNAYNLRRSFDHINDMVDGWYKTYFQQYMVIIKEDLYLPAKQVGDPDDPYPAAVSQMLKHVTGVMPSDIFHSYAMVRQRANSNLADYPTLHFGAKPEPDWFANPVAPTQADFDAAYAELLADTPRDADLDSEDLVLVHDITPAATGTDSATQFLTKYRANYVFVGPGSITVTPESGVSTTTAYGDGIHNITVGGGNSKTVVSNTGGFLFLDSFPQTYKDPDGGAGHWLYIPQRAAGQVNITSTARLRLVDATGIHNIVAEIYSDYVSPANIGPGQVKIDNANTRGEFSNLNANRYISMHPTIALMPRVIADEDFPNRSVVSVTP